MYLLIIKYYDLQKCSSPVMLRNIEAIGNAPVSHPLRQLHIHVQSYITVWLGGN